MPNTRGRRGAVACAAPHRRGEQGFTLIELMIVLVIAAILFFIALPAYQDSVLRANRNVGRGVLFDVTSRQEQYFINNKSYADSLAAIGLDSDGDDKYFIDDQAQETTSSDAIYVIEMTSVNYTATPRNRQARDTWCNVLTLTQAGVKGISGGSLSTSLCW